MKNLPILPRVPSAIRKVTAPLALLLVLGFCLDGSATAASKKKPASKVAHKSVVQPGAKPLKLGDGIFILGDDTSGAPLKISAQMPMSKAASILAGGGGQLPSRSAMRSASPGAAPRALTGAANARLVNFCRSYLGRKLGNGQCSELAMLGLPAVGAQMDLNNQWGSLVCDMAASGGRQTIAIARGMGTKNPSKANVKPGDIIQFENVLFEKSWDGGYSNKSYPHHTAVIEKVSRDGRTYQILEQNVNGTQYVLQSTLALGDFTQGTMRITRPISLR